jgi:hypothetical protein
MPTSVLTEPRVSNDLQLIIREIAQNGAEGGMSMKKRYMGFYRTRMPKMSTGKKITWIPLFRLSDADDDEQKEKDAKKKRTTQKKRHSDCSEVD